MREIWRQALASCGCEAEEAAITGHDLFWRDRHGLIQVFEDVALQLERLHGRFHLAVITNGPRDTQMDKLQVYGLERYFDVFVASSDVGALKPDPSIFRLALDRLEVSPEAAWHVGDNLQTDGAGAKAAGITPVWLNREGSIHRPDDPLPDYEIASLPELMSLLET